MSSCRYIDIRCYKIQLSNTWTENPRVVSSILTLGTNDFGYLGESQREGENGGVPHGYHENHAQKATLGAAKIVASPVVIRFRQRGRRASRDRSNFRGNPAANRKARGVHRTRADDP